MPKTSNVAAPERTRSAPAGIAVYADGPTLDEVRSLDRGTVHGYTFNPTLFRTLGVTDYLGHCKTVAQLCAPLPVSLEVFADDREGMIRQAGILAALGPSVFVKIPITYTNGQSTLEVIQELAQRGVKLNITAVFTMVQVRGIIKPLRESGAIISIFAGRLYDIGRDALVETREIARFAHAESDCRVLWASPRMVYDYRAAIAAGCDIITMQPSLIKKLPLFGKSAEEYSLDTVRMFHKDATASGYTL